MKPSRHNGLASAAPLLLLIAIGASPAISFTSDRGAYASLHALLDFGVGSQHRVWFDSASLEDRVLVAVSREDGALETLEVSADCQTITRQRAADLSPPAQGRDLAVEAIQDEPIILTGSMQVEALLRDEGRWRRSMVIPRRGSGTLRYRSVVAAEDKLHVVQIETRYGKRQLGFDAEGRVSAASAERYEVLRYFSVSAGADLQLGSDVSIAQLSGAGLPRSLDIELVDQMPTVLLASQAQSGEGQLDLYRLRGKSWTRSTLVQYRDSTPPLAHLDEEGVAYARRMGVGLYRFDTNKSGHRPEEWSDWSPQALESISGLLAWTDARRAGQRWWGNIPFIQLINPNNSPTWLNNDVLVDRDAPKILTPWPVRVEQFRLHRIDDALLLLWLGYQEFNGQAEVFAREPLGLFCQRFDWSMVQ